MDRPDVKWVCNRVGRVILLLTSVGGPGTPTR